MDYRLVLQANQMDTMVVTLRQRQHARICKNLSRMVIMSSFTNSLFEIPYSICNILYSLGIYSPFLQIFYRIATILNCLLLSVDLLNYYFFNTLYKRILNGYIRNALIKILS